MYELETNIHNLLEGPTYSRAMEVTHMVEKCYEMFLTHMWIPLATYLGPNFEEQIIKQPGTQGPNCPLLSFFP